MSMIIAENVSHSYGAQEVLRNVSFRLSPADRVGLVGPNGEGKTTLLCIMGDLLEPTSGRVHHSRGLRVGHLPQIPSPVDECTVHEAMLAVFDDLRRMERDLADLAARLAADGGSNDDLLRQYGVLQSKFETLGGHTYTTRIEQVLTGLAFDRSMWDQPLAQLSGGQRTRAALAKLLLREPQLLMLDEPTNHLDLDSVEWLEYWLRSFRGALVVVSHDRYFLDHVTADTWEVAFGGIETYHGSYSAYLMQRAERHKERMRRWEEQQEYIAKTEEFIARHLAGQRTKEAQGRRTRLERFLRDSAIDRPQQHREITLRLSAEQRTGDLVLRTGRLAVGYEASRPLLDVERLEVRRGQRIAIVGPNGAGKTTLLRTLLGELPPLAGDVRHGSRLDVGYLSQTHGELYPTATVLEAVMDCGGDCTEAEARNLLGSLLLSGDDAFKRVGNLSGGERSRVVLARLVLRNANVLMLDEPTNHLDIPSREIIQAVLQGFEGTVLMVSHDRYLIEAVATDVWVVNEGCVVCLEGGWEKYLLWRSQRPGTTATDRSTTSTRPASRDDRRAEHRAARKQSNMERRLKARHEALETEIEKREVELAALMEQISVAGQQGDLARVEELGRSYQEGDAKLKQLWTEWEEIGEQLG
ncbi:MAG: ABC-F family ATP-binding cassette domain-containing protein [Phycisphaerae bacterium]|nr:ABC-F family ATP-binding cassette domain-containing protein [Phycisphaerae bacterium]